MSSRLLTAQTAPVTAAISSFSRTFASVRKHRNYRLFFTGQVISLVGTWMQNIALAWYVIELTHPRSPSALAFCRFAPFTVFGLISGVVAASRQPPPDDGTQSASMVVAAALAVLASPAPRSSGSPTCSRPRDRAVFDAPPTRAHLPDGRATSSERRRPQREPLQRVARRQPAVAGVIIAAFGVGVCFALNTRQLPGRADQPVLMRADGSSPRSSGRHPSGSEHPRGISTPAARRACAWCWR
jgi:hypothetical protein